MWCGRTYARDGNVDSSWRFFIQSLRAVRQARNADFVVTAIFENRNLSRPRASGGVPRAGGGIADSIIRVLGVNSVYLFRGSFELWRTMWAENIARIRKLAEGAPWDR